MLTPEQVQGLQVAFEQMAEPVTEYLVRDVARRVSEAGQLTSTAAYQIWRLQELGKSLPEVEAEVSRLLGKQLEEIRRLFTQAAEVGYNFDIDRLHPDAVLFAENTSIQQMVSAAVALADQDFQNITQTMGFIGSDGKARTLTDAYRNATDEAFNLIISGATDYNTAIRRACAKLISEGIRSIEYDSGMHTSLEAAIRRNMMGGLGLLVEQISERNHDDLGADGWEISAHAASAPDHEPIQGRQYSDEAYQRLNNSLRRRIGTLNCGHNAFPIILGVNAPQYTQSELDRFREDNAKGVNYEGRHFDTVYEATQYQRRIERAIRAQKRRVMVDEGSRDGEQLEQDRIKLRRMNEEYRRFCRSTSLRPENERLQVSGFGRGHAARVNAGAERYYQKWSRGIGAHRSIETLAKYYDVKYTDSPRYELLKGYARAVEKGDISPLVGFDQYEKTSKEIQNRLVGVTTSTGITIENFATHFVDRVIGQTSTPHSGKRCGVSVDSVLDTLQNPRKIGAVRVSADGDVRQTLFGDKAVVTMSIRDKRLIQTNP